MNWCASSRRRHQLIALLYGQVAGACSLREIETTMASHQARLYHVGGRVPRRSTFADANRSRSPLVFSGLFQHMLGMATRAVRRKVDHMVLLIDSTSLHLAGIGTQWARFSAEVCGAKAHVVYDPDLGHPVYHAVSAANVNDITSAKKMPIQPGATYVFDLGYYDYGWWAELDAGRLPHRHTVQDQHAAAPGPRHAARSRDRTCCPTASASCPPVKPEAGTIRCRSPCARSW